MTCCREERTKEGQAYADDPPPMVVMPELDAVPDDPQRETRAKVAGRVDGVAWEVSREGGQASRGGDRNEEAGVPEIQPLDMPMETTTKPRTMAPSPAPGGALFCVEESVRMVGVRTVRRCAPHHQARGRQC